MKKTFFEFFVRKIVAKTKTLIDCSGSSQSHLLEHSEAHRQKRFDI